MGDRVASGVAGRSEERLGVAEGVAAAVDILPVFVALQQFQALQANTPACSAGVVYLRLKMDGL